MAAGGIGGYYGGILAKDGHEVTFVARGDHLRAIREQGLHVTSIDDDFTISPARSTDRPPTIGPVDLVIFSVKAYDTVTAVDAIKPIIGPETMVVTFQNGVDSYGEIARGVGEEHVLAAPTQIVTFIAAPGEIKQISPFRSIVLGEMDGRITPRLEQLASLFRPHGVQVTITKDIRTALWIKFMRLASLGLCSLARTAPYDLFQMPEARETLAMAIEEVRAVGQADGVDVGPTAVQESFDWVLTLKPGQKPSMLTDLERGNRLEIDALSGAVVRIGKRHSVPTPVHKTVYVGLKPIDLLNASKREASAPVAAATAAGELE
jgi:2-dehydropantoate 2-reductase